MHRLIVLFVTITLLATVAAAQDTGLLKPDRGISGGLASARFHDSPFETGSAKGFVFGVFMDFRISENLSIQTEILYTEKGSKIYIPSFDTEFDLNLDYIEVPITVNYRLQTEKMFQPRIFAGPYAGFLINSSASVTIADDIISTPDDFVDEANDLDWGAVIGAGIDAHLTFRTITFKVRYSTGFSNAFNSSIPGDYKNGVFSILLGFTI